MDNEDNWKRTNTTKKVVNHSNQYFAAEIIAIKNLMEEADLDIILIRRQGHREARKDFHQNPGPELIRMCDEKSKKNRINTVNKETNNIIRHCGEKAITKSGRIESFPVKELIGEGDTEEEESDYAKKV